MGTEVITFVRRPRSLLRTRTFVFFLLSIGLAAQDEATRLLQQINADLAAGRYPAVIQQGTVAAAAFHKSGDRTHEARALTGVGLAELYSGNYPAALPRLTEALEIDRASSNSSAEITDLNNIGTSFYFQGRYAEAMNRYEEALRRVGAFPNEKWMPSRRQLTQANIAILYQTLGQFERALSIYSELLHSQQVLPLREQAQLLTNIGALRRRLGDPVKALETYRAAQVLYQREQHRDGEIAVLNNIGIVQSMDLNDSASAAATFTLALRLAEETGDRPLAVHARLYRGEAYYRAGRMHESAGDFNVAADQAGALGEQEESWKALYGLARLASADGDIARADGLLERAVKTIESMRAGLGGSSLRSDFLADKRDVYDLLIEHATNPDYIFRLMEQSRARNLRDRLSSTGPQELSAVARSLRADHAILEYWIGQSSAAVLWIASSGTGVKRWKLSAGDSSGITALAALVADPASRNWRAAARPIARQLFDGIPPLTQAGIHYVAIIPDGELALLPFEALPLDDSSLLIERFAVSYSPAASLVTPAALKRAFLWPWQQTLEAFADPSPGGGTSGVDLAALQAWPRLPGAAREATGIARALGGRTDVHIGSDARKRFVYRAALAPVLHFATHAYADTQDPNGSYILLAPASADQRFDYLFLSEVRQLTLAGVDLVTVSACQTGAGKLVRGEGVESFSRAFMSAGARSVVTSMWPVGDRSTAEIMLRFYSALAAGDSKTDALRAAKLQFLHSPGASHPAYWAAFVLNGDSDSRLPRVIGWGWFVVPALVILLLLLLFFFRMRARKG